MGHEAAFKTDAAGLELIRATSVLAVDQTHELRRSISVVVGWAVS